MPRPKKDPTQLTVIERVYADRLQTLTVDQLTAELQEAVAQKANQAIALLAGEFARRLREA